MPASKKPTAKPVTKTKAAPAKKAPAAIKAAAEPKAEPVEPDAAKAAAKPAKAHAGKPEQPLWQRFNQNHSQKMSKGRSFRHQGR
ncbi:MAG TPA: hypothetical protein VGM68_01680 [Rhizomicrobium sp.]|jgi:hypothetical protein